MAHTVSTIQMRISLQETSGISLCSVYQRFSVSPELFCEFFLDGLTGKATWTEDGECDKEPKAFVIENGEYKEME